MHDQKTCRAAVVCAALMVALASSWPVVAGAKPWDEGDPFERGDTPSGQATAPVRQPVDPLVSMALSVATPLVLLSLTSGMGGTPASIALSPRLVILFGFGAGHLHAGDPGRGFLVGLGAVGTSLLATGVAYATATGEGQSRGFAVEFGSLVLNGAALLGYGTFAAIDAYATTVRLNETQPRGPQPRLDP